ncbi:MAG TPA: hypothetical protein PK867_06425 [Pirellulales bacterium]|nr:hypothetical protein [Pirellulales bacterium]
MLGWSGDAETAERLALDAGFGVEESPWSSCSNWTWCFGASLFTLFKISPSRSSEVLLEVLGREFDGVLGCD